MSSSGILVSADVRLKKKRSDIASILLQRGKTEEYEDDSNTSCTLCTCKTPQKQEKSVRIEDHPICLNHLEYFGVR